jgi:hypothetical protein
MMPWISIPPLSHPLSLPLPFTRPHRIATHLISNRSSTQPICIMNLSPHPDTSTFIAGVEDDGGYARVSLVILHALIQQNWTPELLRADHPRLTRRVMDHLWGILFPGLNVGSDDTRRARFEVLVHALVGWAGSQLLFDRVDASTPAPAGRAPGSHEIWTWQEQLRVAPSPEALWGVLATRCSPRPRAGITQPRPENLICFKELHGPTSTSRSRSESML